MEDFKIDPEKLRTTMLEYSSRPWYSDIVDNISFLCVLIKSDGLISGCRVFFLTMRDQRRYAKKARARLNKFAAERGYIRVKGKFIKSNG